MIIKPLIKNFIVYQGTTFMANFQWDIDSYILTDDCKSAMQIRSAIDSDIVIEESTTENGKIMIHPSEKIISIKIPATDTEKYKFEKAVYDIEIEFPNKDRFRIAQGSLTLNKEVTRNI